MKAERDLKEQLTQCFSKGLLLALWWGDKFAWHDPVVPLQDIQDLCPPLPSHSVPQVTTKPHSPGGKERAVLALLKNHEASLPISQRSRPVQGGRITLHLPNWLVSGPRSMCKSPGSQRWVFLPSDNRPPGDTMAVCMVT